jgi:hypothetical protein
MLSLLALKAEALHLADRTLEALETIKEALVEASEARWWSAELYRLPFLKISGGNCTERFCDACDKGLVNVTVTPLSRRFPLALSQPGATQASR